MTWDGRHRATDPTPGDVPWTNITPAAGFTSGTMQYRVRNGWVSVRVDGAATTVNNTVLTLANVAAIPADYRPGVQARLGGYFGGWPGVVTVGTDGSITALQETGANRGSVSCTLAYPVE